MKMTRNGQTVQCYGEMRPGQNCLVVGDYEDGTELEEFCCDTFEDWPTAVEALTLWANRIKAEIMEISAC